MKISSNCENGILYLFLSGECSVSLAGELKTQFHEALSSPAALFELDVSELTAIDVPILQLIYAFRTALSAKGKVFAIRSVPSDHPFHATSRDLGLCFEAETQERRAVDGV